MVWRLQDDDPTLFPNPHCGDEDGLIAVGGDLSPERLVCAYSNGIFPWYGFKENEDIMWWCPLKRFVIFPDEIHISHSMKQLIKKGTYTVTINEAFDEVIEQCSRSAQRDEQRGAWLGPDMVKAYKAMFDLGLASSVEVWDENGNPSTGSGQTENENVDEKCRLVGGLYGINIGYNFFGESMFSLVPSASKLALIFLAQKLQPFGGIIDCQFETPHLRSMGGRHITYEEYMEHLNQEYE